MDVLLPFALAVAVLYLPGGALLLAARCRMPFRAGLAPVTTAAMLSGLAFAFHLLHIPWRLHWVMAAVAVVVACGALAGRAVRRRGLLDAGPRAQSPGPRGPLATALTLLGCVIAGAILLVPVALVPGASLAVVSGAFDAVFHYNAVATIKDAGDAAPWTALRSMYGGTSPYYPVAFHQVASLVPASAVVATNATVLALLVSTGPAVASLLWAVVPRHLGMRERGIVIAGAVPLTTLFLSIPSMGLLMALWPNMFAAVAFPAVLAAVLNAVRVLGAPEARGSARRMGRTALSLLPEALIVAGGILIHPSTVFAMLLIAFALGAAHALLAVRRAPRQALLEAAVLVVVLVGSIMLSVRYLRGMALTEGIEMPLSSVVLTLLADRPRLGIIPLTSAYAIIPYVLAVIGVVSAVLLRSRLRLALCAVAFAALVVAFGTAYGFLPLSSLANPWYQARERVVPMLTTCVIALAAIGACVVVRAVEARGPRWGTAAALGLAVVMVIPPLISTTDPRRMPLVARLAVTGGEGYLVSTVAPREEDFIVDTAEELPEDAVVLGDPADGAAMYWALGERHVVFPHLGRPSTPALLEIAADADEMGTDPRLCALVDAHGENVYLYRDISDEARSRSYAPGYDYYSGVRDLRPGMLKTVAVSEDGRYSLHRVDVPC